MLHNMLAVHLAALVQGFVHSVMCPCLYDEFLHWHMCCRYAALIEDGVLLKLVCTFAILNAVSSLVPLQKCNGPLRKSKALMWLGVSHRCKTLSITSQLCFTAIADSYCDADG